MGNYGRGMSDSSPKSEQLKRFIEAEGASFRETYEWLQSTMSPAFFEEVEGEEILLIVHGLMGLPLQGYFTQIRSEHRAFVLHLDSADADIRVLSHYRFFGIKSYRAFLSRTPPPMMPTSTHLRIALITFTEAREESPMNLSQESKEKLYRLLLQRQPDLTTEHFDHLLNRVKGPFLASLSVEELVSALHMFLRAEERDHCQYELHHNESWAEEKEPSLQLFFAWKNTPKYDFLYRLAKLVHRHQLVMRGVHAAYVDPYTSRAILVMVIGLHGSNGKAAKEAADLPDFLRELVTLKYFSGFPLIVKTFVDSGLIRGNLGNLLKTISYFIHQILVRSDIHLYTIDSIEEALCRHPNLTIEILHAFEAKFHPETHDHEQSERILQSTLNLIDLLDTGHETNDERRKAVLQQAVMFVRYCLKTNFYRNNKSAFGFRLDPNYLENAPWERKTFFPELPYAIFFIKGMHFIGFHIRFRDLSRGGLRTVFPANHEEMLAELNHVMIECYNLAYTQQKKNKDIPEGGAKGIIFLKPFQRLEIDAQILKQELEEAGFSSTEIKEKVKSYIIEQKKEYLLATQRAYVANLMTLVNCTSDGALKAKHIVDYYKRPEYLYLGPDEKMSAEMINWIARHSQLYDYKPGISFISSKPRLGINHKQYGVTSLGVHVYVKQVLAALHIDPSTTPFRVKISGGPDGDVAGNEILNFFKDYPETAKLVALTDVSGTINDPEGLNLEELSKLFYEEKPISAYPPEALSEGGFLLDRTTVRQESAYSQVTLCWRKRGERAERDWLSSNEAVRLFHHNVHQTPADLFIPAGGRPRTLNRHNWEEFCDVHGEPTARAIVEGANLYLTPTARESLENLGVLIIRDSSANKCGVIASSFEVLVGLVLNEQEMLQFKELWVQETLELLAERAAEEGALMLDTHRRHGTPLTRVSEEISSKINLFTDQIFRYLEPLSLPKNLDDPLMRCLANYLPPLLREKYLQRAIEELPPVHQKAMIASYIARRLVYERGLSWWPSIVDLLPVLLEDPRLFAPHPPEEPQAEEGS